MNNVTMSGRLGQDPELRNTPNGNSVVSFNIANSEYGGKDESGQAKYVTTWVRVVAWGSFAEYLAKRLKKGNDIVIHGKLAIRSYEKDGQTKYVTEIVAREYHAGAPARGDSSGDTQSSGGDGAAPDLFGSDGYAKEDIPF